MPIFVKRIKIKFDEQKQTATCDYTIDDFSKEVVNNGYEVVPDDEIIITYTADYILFSAVVSSPSEPVSLGDLR